MKTNAIVLVAKQKSYICQICAQRLSWDKYRKIYGVAVTGATFAFCRFSDSESSFVSAQEITATRARVGHLVCKKSYMAEKSGFNRM